MALVKIDLDRRIGTIDRMVYWMFVEHLGRCIYGGMYDPVSSLSDENGFRRDVLEAARGLQVPILRYPGGNFVSGYHWIDGGGGVLQPRGRDVVPQAADGARVRRAAQGDVLGARQRDVRGLADRSQERAGLHQVRPAV